MFREYFIKKQKELLKKNKISSKSSAKTGTAGAKTKSKKISTEASYDVKNFEKLMENLMPQNLLFENASAVDASGYVPENLDYIIYYNKWPYIKDIMGGYVPAELIYATCHVEKKLTKTSIDSVLNKVVLAKKLNRFTEETNQSYMIPSFMVVYESTVDLPDIKNRVVDYYMNKSVDPLLEFDVMMVVNKGIVIKDWREKRKFVALETGRDSLMWFFVLMNEYLEIDEQREVDLRNYIHQKERYNEY
jgi:hypothetical protein